MSALVAASLNAVSGTSYPSLRPAQLGAVRGATPAERTKSVHAWRWSATSAYPELSMLLVQFAMTSARSFVTCSVVQTRGFHMIVIGARYARAMSHTLFMVSLDAASPSKSRVHTKYSGWDSTNDHEPTTLSVPSASRTSASTVFSPVGAPSSGTTPVHCGTGCAGGGCVVTAASRRRSMVRPVE